MNFNKCIDITIFRLRLWKKECAPFVTTRFRLRRILFPRGGNNPYCLHAAPIDYDNSFFYKSFSQAKFTGNLLIS
jgi:hypothetical protein